MQQLFKKMHTGDQNDSRESGVALLFAILLTSTLLLVALGISRISYKEILFSLEARDSDRAFTAADTGLECGMYLDQNGVFDSVGDTFYCHGIPIVLFYDPSGTTLQFSLPLSPNSCAQVFVDTDYLGGDQTRIESYGYNVRQQQPDAPPTCVINASNPRIVTRALRTTYDN